MNNDFTNSRVPHCHDQTIHFDVVLPSSGLGKRTLLSLRHYDIEIGHPRLFQAVDIPVYAQHRWVNSPASGREKEW